MPFFGVPIRNGLPIGLGSVAGFGVQQFDPSLLFEGGTVAGAWYDPSDLSTMFDTSTGTTPVAMPGLGSAVSVGLMLDKSQGLVLGSELVTNGDFSSGTTGWSALNAATLTAPASALVVANSGTNFGGADQAISTVIGTTYRVTCTFVRGTSSAVYLQAGTTSGGAQNGFATSTTSSGSLQVIFRATATTTYISLFNGESTAGLFNTFDSVSLRTLAGNHAIAFNNTTARPELRARVNLLVATATLSTQNVTTQATSYTLSFAGAGSITLSGTATGSYSAGTHTITCTAGTLTLTVSGTVTTADLRPANSGALLPAYQAVVDANTYDTSGFPLYLLFEGAVGQRGMYTPANLNLSGTDKVAVFAGVRKLAAGTLQLVEFSADTNTNNGVFSMPQDVGTNTWTFVSKGTTAAIATSGSLYASPITVVNTGIGNISAPAATLRSNGAQVANITTSQGSGNFGTYPLYIGSRGNSSLWFNGHLHSLIIAGSAVSAGNISATEQWVAGKTGIQI